MGIFQSKPKENSEINSDNKQNKPILSYPEPNSYYIRRERAPLILFLRYIGTNYHGLQYQLNARTIDSDLFIALEKSGFTPPHTNKCRGRINWSEASRTDSGVHACAQLVEFTARNVEGMKCSEIVDIINKNLPSDSTVEIMTAVSPNNQFPIQKFATARKYRFLLPTHTFRLQTEEHFKYLREDICPCFVGLQNFHNYTSDKPAEHASAKRRITDFTFSDPFDIDGEEFVLFYIRGESFMLNQIRKMIAMVCSASHGQVTAEEVKRSLTVEKWSIQIIPGDGLMLDQIEYESYMKTTPKLTSNTDYEFSAWRPNIEEWKKKVLFRHIAKIVREQDMYRNWLQNRLLKHGVKCG